MLELKIGDIVRDVRGFEKDPEFWIVQSNPSKTPTGFRVVNLYSNSRGRRARRDINFLEPYIMRNV